MPEKKIEVELLTFEIKKLILELKLFINSNDTKK